MSKTSFFAAALVLLAASTGTALAQTGTVSGTVTDSTTAEPLPGVNVIVEGLGIGAATDVQGRFEIADVPVGEQALVASFIGYQTRSVPVDVQEGSNQVDVRLSSQAIGLDDVVVTALGIEREERSLGYAVEEVEGAALDRVPETNFVSSLAGRVAGAQISTASQMGGSTRIVLRGASSVLGDNEPLFVVDGVPLDNSNFNTAAQADGSGGYDYGNAASMINPADIQSVSVLKGPSAAALYGSRASNGAILITTKSGQRDVGIGVTVQTGVSFSELYNLPDYQDAYGGGAWAPFSVNEEGQFVADFGTDQSWGPALDGREVRQWYSYDDVNGLLGQATPWVARPDNVADYFRTGLNFTTNVAFSQGGENFNYRLSLNNTEETGVFPNSGLGRNTISFNGALDLTDRLSTDVSANYVDEDAQARPGTGYTNATGPWLQFNQFGQRQIDLGEDSYHRDYRRADGTQRGWNWIGDPAEGNLIYANNPYWIAYENFQNDDTERLYGNVSVAYDFLDNLTLTASGRTDFYTSRRQERVAVGSVELSEYEEAIREVQETNGSLELVYDGQLSERFSLSTLAGTNYRYNTYSLNAGQTLGGLSTPGLYTVENSISRPDIDDYFEEYGIFSLYGNVTAGYRDVVYLEGTLRNDRSSTLPAGNNSYLYPSVNASFAFSDLPVFQDSDVLSFGKLRVGWSQVGNDTSPYRLAFTYPLGFPYGTTPLQSLPTSLNNADLKPEITSGYEVGTQLQFFSNRLGLDATYYAQETRNQILAVEVSRASGFRSTVVNAGTIANRGLELALNFTPVLTQDLQWDVNLNWAKNVNKVVRLQEELRSVTLGGPPFGPDIVARVGEPYGAFYGTGFVYDEAGNKVVGSGGTYESTSPQVLGSYIPDWTGGVSTTLSYKGVTASAVLDGQKGGEIWSLSNTFGLYSGIFAETAENDIREVGIVPEGVTEDGEAWTGRVDPNVFFSSLFGVQEAFLYDASYVRLREVSLAYTLPRRWFGNLPVQGLTVSAVGRNLATLLKYTPNFDPATALSASNVQGIESGQMPPTRTIGLRLRATF